MVDARIFLDHHITYNLTTRVVEMYIKKNVYFGHNKKKYGLSASICILWDVESLPNAGLNILSLIPSRGPKSIPKAVFR